MRGNKNKRKANKQTERQANRETDRQTDRRRKQTVSDRMQWRERRRGTGHNFNVWLSHGNVGQRTENKYKYKIQIFLNSPTHVYPSQLVDST